MGGRLSEVVGGRTALVTGAAGGLGKEFAKRLLRAGAKVCLADINEELGRRTLKEFTAEFGHSKVTFVKCDVTKDEDWTAAFSLTLSFFSSSQLDILVNNAGVMGEREGWRKCVDINLGGVLKGTMTAMEQGRMSKERGGSGGTVVQVSSILGLFNAHQPKGWAYNVSKSAVVSFVRCLGGGEAETGVRVLGLCPSVADTPILDGCSTDELDKIRRDVGGIMDKEQVGDAFESLLSSVLPSGSVAAVWKGCPPYLVPDAGFASFLAATVVAMTFRFVPGFKAGTVLGPCHAVGIFTFFPLALFASMWLWSTL